MLLYTAPRPVARPTPAFFFLCGLLLVANALPCSRFPNEAVRSIRARAWLVSALKCPTRCILATRSPKPRAPHARHGLAFQCAQTCRWLHPGDLQPYAVRSKARHGSAAQCATIAPQATFWQFAPLSRAPRSCHRMAFQGANMFSLPHVGDAWPQNARGSALAPQRASTLTSIFLKLCWRTARQRSLTGKGLIAQLAGVHGQ